MTMTDIEINALKDELESVKKERESYKGLYEMYYKKYEEAKRNIEMIVTAPELIKRQMS